MSIMKRDALIGTSLYARPDAVTAGVAGADLSFAAAAPGDGLPLKDDNGSGNGTVSVAARTVGALIVSSMMVVPVACAMRIAKSYFQTVLYSIGFALLFMMVGLFAAFYLGLRPGGTVVLAGVLFLTAMLALGGRRVKKRARGADGV